MSLYIVIVYITNRYVYAIQILNKELIVECTLFSGLSNIICQC